MLKGYESSPSILLHRYPSTFMTLPMSKNYSNFFKLQLLISLFFLSLYEKYNLQRVSLIVLGFVIIERRPLILPSHLFLSVFQRDHHWNPERRGMDSPSLSEIKHHSKEHPLWFPYSMEKSAYTKLTCSLWRQYTQLKALSHIRQNLFGQQESYYQSKEIGIIREWNKPKPLYYNKQMRLPCATKLTS